MKAKRKLNSKRGFSLAETLMAILILLMVSTIVATGMPAARDAYQKVVLTANAQTLLSTAVNALRDEIGTAWDVRKEIIEGVTSLTYMSSDTGARSRLYVTNDATFGEIIMLEENAALTELGVTTQSGTARPLVKDGISSGSAHLSVSYTSADLSTDGSSVIIRGLKVTSKEGSDTKILIEMKDDAPLTIRVFK